MCQGSIRFSTFFNYFAFFKSATGRTGVSIITKRYFAGPQTMSFSATDMPPASCRGASEALCVVVSIVRSERQD